MQVLNRLLFPSRDFEEMFLTSLNGNGWLKIDAV